MVTTSLTSALTYIAAAGETTTNSNGTTVQNAKAQATEEARQNFVDGMKDIFQQILQDKTDISAVAYVPAGTRIIIYPKVDLWIRTPAREEEEEKEASEPTGQLATEDDVKNKKADDAKSNGGGGTVHVMGAEDEEAQPSGGLIDEPTTKKKTSSRSAPVYNGAPPPPPSTGASSSAYNQQSGALF